MQMETPPPRRQIKASPPIADDGSLGRLEVAFEAESGEMVVRLQVAVLGTRSNLYRCVC